MYWEREKPIGYAIIDSEDRFVWFKGDVNSQYELELFSVPNQDEMIDLPTAETRLNRIMEDSARHKDLLHFPVKIIPLFFRHIMTAEETERGPASR
jgi:hypothetical protein